MSNWKCDKSDLFVLINDSSPAQPSQPSPASPAQPRLVAAMREKLSPAHCSCCLKAKGVDEILRKFSHIRLLAFSHWTVTWRNFQQGKENIVKTFEAHCSFSRFATITNSNWSKWSITILTEPLKNILHSLKNLDDDAEKYKIMFRLILSGCGVEMRCAEAGLPKRKISKWPDTRKLWNVFSEN